MTEIIWEGKYKDNKKCSPIRIALPFQTIETINESAADREKRLTNLFQHKNDTGNWQNRLIWGDKKYVLPSLLPEFAGKVNLIYIDPPFDTGADFSFTATVPNHPDEEDEGATSFIKQPSIIERKAYRDTWGVSDEEKKNGATHLDKYLKWFYETVSVLYELLAEDGSIYVHLDWHVGHYAKCVMDEIFGYENFLNEIAWTYFAFKRKTSKKFPMKHDTIMSWTKTDKYKWNTQYKPHKEEYLKRWKKDKDGRLYRDDVNPTKGGTRIIYLDEIEGDIVDSVWDDINPVNPVATEKTNYATQKPESLLERIVKASSDEGDLVLDCFAGSGTTAAVAEKLKRRWIACDLGRYAIHTTRKRLLTVTDVKPFIVQNLGKYERQQWMQSEFDDLQDRAVLENKYRNFILELYHAKPVTGYTWLHGIKASRFIHIGGVDAPICDGDIKQIVMEFWKTVGKNSEMKTNGIDIIGWDFAFELNEIAAQYAAANKVDLKFKKIPREVLEKKAVEQGDIKFFELASLTVKSKIEKNKIKLALKNFIIPPDDIPIEVKDKITHWSQWIDYWAIDWNYKDDTFHNERQSYRTKQNPGIETETFHEYEEKGKYIIIVKVIDILGNDTTKSIEINI